MKKLIRQLIHRLPYILCGLLMVPLLACSSGYSNNSTTATTTTPVSASGGNSVNIANFAFAPATLTVKVGTTVTWTNNDSVGHTVTSDSGIFDSGSLATGKSFSYTFSNAGTFPYHCAIHTSMKASVIVQ